MKNREKAKNGSRARLISLITVVLFLVVAAVSAFFSDKAEINYNLADYLGSDTQTKTALDIIDEEFGMTGTLQIMAKDVSPDAAEEILARIENVPNILIVNFDKNDETYYKDGNALFVAVINGDDYSENAKQMISDVKDALSDYDGIEYGGTATEKQNLRNSITSEMVYILAVSLCFVAVILLITSESWLEPLVLLAASGVAVLINRGTNVFFGEISYITNSVSAILQLALSIDYSIVLLHSYRREKEKTDDCGKAMSAAIRSVVKPVSASALTTIAGLLALLFMSFRIGFDIGTVLMKGIVISAVTSLTLLPSLVLIFDKPMKNTKKKAFVPRGNAFCKIAFTAGKWIVPTALVVIVLCGFLQTKNTFIFSDTSSGNPEISEVFGNGNSVAVVYENLADGLEKEGELARDVSEYKTKDGKNVLTNYTSYSNTAAEFYDTKKAANELEISEKDAELFFAMYNLYRSPSDVRMSFTDFVDFAESLAKNDADVLDFVDEDTTNALETLKAVSEITSEELGASELYEKLTSGVMGGTDISPFSIKQLYGLYFYDSISEKNVDFKAMLDFLVTASEKSEVGGMFDAETVAGLKTLSAGIAQFDAQMEMPTDKATFKGWAYKNLGVLLTDEQVAGIYAGYFAAVGVPEGETIPFLPLMKFLVQSGNLTDENALAAIKGYEELYGLVKGKYSYEEFIPALEKAASALSGKAEKISAKPEEIRQIYIMYFRENGRIPNGKINGKTFAEFALAADREDSAVHSALTDENREKLEDMLTAEKYFSDASLLTYEEACEKISALRSEMKSGFSASELGCDKISGVYIKYALKNGVFSATLIKASDLLDFASENMNTNALLSERMTDENREKIRDAQKDVKKARDLFVGENYSRMLLSVDLPNEGEDTTEFVEFLSARVKEIFGDGAYITGEIVSTYDLEKSFDHDNTFITVFTLVSIFVIVTVVFGSLSLPVILVTVIQGAIFVAMSTQLLGGGIFFMSYIVSTCILMGATIDYGILMSSGYVAQRAVCDKKEALRLSVSAAMPTVFTSGLILTVCGFVIHFISGQNSVSTVGLLIGVGTVCSVIMITVVLPSVLYLLDKFVLVLSKKKKNR